MTLCRQSQYSVLNVLLIAGLVYPDLHLKGSAYVAQL